MRRGGIGWEVGEGMGKGGGKEEIGAEDEKEKEGEKNQWGEEGIGVVKKVNKKQRGSGKRGSGVD